MEDEQNNNKLKYERKIQLLENELKQFKDKLFGIFNF